MKRERAAPGDGSFMKHSPIRKPWNPAACSWRMVAGLDIPLSLTLIASFGRSEARRNELSTEVMNVPRLRLLIPQRSGSMSVYSSSSSLCISSSTSSCSSWAVRSRLRHSYFDSSAAIRRTAEAPQSRAWKSWYSSMTKFL